MIAYLDSSVVLRVVLSQRDILREWDSLITGVSSSLLRVECFRTLDRLWHQGELDEQELEQKHVAVDALLPRLQLAPPSDHLLKRASQSFPTIVKTLDAIHLATAMSFRDQQPGDEWPIYFATHDNKLAAAARAMNFAVLGA